MAVFSCATLCLLTATEGRGDWCLVRGCHPPASTPTHLLLYSVLLFSNLCGRASQEQEFHIFSILESDVQQIYLLYALHSVPWKIWHLVPLSNYACILGLCHQTRGGRYRRRVGNKTRNTGSTQKGQAPMLERKDARSTTPQPVSREEEVDRIDRGTRTRSWVMYVDGVPPTSVLRVCSSYLIIQEKRAVVIFHRRLLNKRVLSCFLEIFLATLSRVLRRKALDCLVIDVLVIYAKPSLLNTAPTPSYVIAIYRLVCRRQCDSFLR